MTLSRRVIKRSSRAVQAGLSLVELMVASVLSLIIVAALTQLFVDISATNHEMAKTNSQIENARFAMQFLQGDVIHAGYWGGFVPGWDDLANEDPPLDLPASLPSACEPYLSWPAGHEDGLIGIPLVVYSGVPTGCSGVVTDKVADTDVLIVRHASTCVAGETNCEAFDTNKLYMTVSNCQSEIEAGTQYSLDPNDVTLTEKDCATLVPYRKFEQAIYYIRDHSVAGDGVPTLVRSEFDWNGTALVQGAAQALVEGIEAFRVEVGIDSESASGATVDYTSAVAWLDPEDRSTPTNRANGVPDSLAFVHCPSETPACDAVDFRDVVAVKMYLLARTSEPTPGYSHGKEFNLGSQELTPSDDGFKRQVYSTTIRLNNVAGRRETPYDPNDP